MDYVAARTMKVNNIRLPSEGMFYNDLKFTYSFFTNRPISAAPGGLVMDVDYNTVVVQARDGSKETRIDFMRSSGITASALEHAVPEQMFSTPDSPAEGISAVKALQLANSQGIPIHTVNRGNINTILPQLELDHDVISDIVNAVNAGKEVTVSKTNIDFHGWNGCGYIIVDPDTGAGMYMISGGLNGGFTSLDPALIKGIVWVAMSIISAVAAIFAPFLIGLFITIGIALATTIIQKRIDRDYQISFKDISLFSLSVIAWASIGSAFMPLILLGPIGLIALSMILMSVVLLDLVIIYAYREAPVYIPLNGTARMVLS
jgi:hypothetical protein